MFKKKKNFQDWKQRNRTQTIPIGPLVSWGVIWFSVQVGHVVLWSWLYGGTKKKKNLLACSILAIQSLPYNQTCWVTVPTTIQQQPQVKTQYQMVGPLGFRRFTRHLPFMVELINGLDMQQYASNLLERQRMDGERIYQFWGHPQSYWGHQINSLAFWTMGPMTCA